MLCNCEGYKGYEEWKGWEYGTGDKEGENIPVTVGGGGVLDTMFLEKSLW
jgi:hypothetical protein